MCIFCERAKAALDDPLAGLDAGGWDASDTFSSSSNINRNNSSRNINREATLRQKREAERCQELKRRARLPVTVITGFLGAGKTTFVNHLLSARHGRRLAVIENEFGEVAVDDALLGDGGFERGEEAQQVILMPNGCMCCRVRGDLVDALKRLIVGYSSSRTPEQAGVAPNGTGETAADHADRAAAEASTAGFLGGKGAVADYADAQVPAAKAEQERRGRLDGIILECSGLDELAPVLQTFFADPFVQAHVRLDAVVCVCDSPRLLRTLVVPPTNTLLATIAVEDSTPGEERCAMGGVDTAKGGVVAEKAGKKTSDVSAALVMSQLALSDRVLLNKSDLITPEEGDALVAAMKEQFLGASVVRCERGKVDVDLVLGVDSFSLGKALEMDQHFAEMLADRPTDKETQGDGKRHEHEGKGHADVVSAQPHGHDRLGAQSVGVEWAEGPIEWAKFMSWLTGFLEKEGDLIWRMKGVLWTTVPPGHGSGATTSWGWGAGRRTVVQGLYGHFESEVSEWPAGATRRSRVVFIGDLPLRIQEALRAGVRSCVAPPRPRPRPALRSQQSTQGTRKDGGAFACRLGSVKFGGGEDHIFL